MATEVEIQLMVQKNANYQWPRPKNKTWLPQTNVLCEINSSKPLQKKVKKK